MVETGYCEDNVNCKFHCVAKNSQALMLIKCTGCSVPERPRDDIWVPGVEGPCILILSSKRR